MRALMTILLLLFFVTTSHAGGRKAHTKSDPLEAQWKNDPSLVELAETDSEIWFGVKGTLRASGEYRSAWVAVFYRAEGRKASGVKGLYATRSKWLINCAENTLNVASVHAYNAKGEQIAEERNDVWDEVAPGTIGHLISSIFCLPIAERSAEEYRTAPF